MHDSTYNNYHEGDGARKGSQLGNHACGSWKNI
jgi:hypothetical protein